MPGELIPIVAIIGCAAVLIFRPLTKRIGSLLERIYEDHDKKQADNADLARIADLMERLVDRIDRIEDRVEFAERMLESRPPLDTHAEPDGRASPRFSRS